MLFNNFAIAEKENDEFIKENGYVAAPVLPSEIRHAISSVRKRTAPSEENKIRTPEEASASLRKHTGSAVHTLPVRMQSPYSVGDQKDRVTV
ncbi:unnamed protein product [Angiostrongylus costaricensis]|uniref:Uncharacterized protein n=1 Tax=Angiostrongylus costaricensis TaxID=334426 RepID=A0A0R3PE94_ANGCS|nr:unnamed protein product [Angiostrongylus costaricensis]